MSNEFLNNSLLPQPVKLRDCDCETEAQILPYKSQEQRLVTSGWRKLAFTVSTLATRHSSMPLKLQLQAELQ